MIRKTIAAACLGAAVLATAMPALGQNLRIALREDPDILDPTLSRTYVGRIVYMGFCDKLFDINERLEAVPQLATGYRWEDPTTLIITLRQGVRFHDGEVMDAEAVRYSLNRHLTMQGSFRRGELGNITAIEVVDPQTVRIKLGAPNAALIATLTDRAGMILSPKAAEAAGRNFGNRPVCAGPMRFVERVAQERIVLERFPEYWDAGRVHLQRVTYLPIPDNTVRLANLQSGAAEFGERMEPDDLRAIQRNRNLRGVAVDELGWQSIQFNVNNGERSAPLRDARVRRAFELSLDRAAIVQVVYEGMFSPTRQPIPPASAFRIPNFDPPARNVNAARALLREAGVTGPLQLEMTVPNNPDLRQVGEVVQAMAREAGFEISLRAMEFASSLQAAQRGDFQLYLVGWSGRTDPDGNIHAFMHTRGGQNDGKYSNPEVDRLLDAARLEGDVAKRRDLYRQAMEIAIAQDMGRMFVWHRKNIMIHSARLQGYQPIADGMIRLQDMRLN
ncbi:ABC transporter substrate-binding protein [Roseomonas sp. AR75]|uniref:ABC transporter substrate-binding protein n=1 Tax=Roseomonas sp. AR75 TaxID=2562311 RepID=UPI0010BFE313|nr:ABC transporter substrate-binding protein [Roseomonas sp. AR75]